MHVQRIALMNGQTTNLFLSSLSPANCEFLLSLSTAVELPLHTVLYEEECTPRYAYFLTSGLASVVTPMSNGEAVEVGFIGREGVVGSLHLLGPTSLSSRCVMQLSGAALRIQYRELQKAYASSDEIRDRTLEFVQEQAAMVGQIAGCNRLHSAEQRLIRWLLTAQDRTQTNDLKFTHEYLAEMIATHRTTITTITRALQKRGFITYSRGTIIILNRDGLEGSACDCYGITKRLYANLYAGEALIASKSRR
jgi:CRP-like cAMP-binding protein